MRKADLDARLTRAALWLDAAHAAARPRLTGNEPVRRRYEARHASAAELLAVARTSLGLSPGGRLPGAEFERVRAGCVERSAQRLLAGAFVAAAKALCAAAYSPRGGRRARADRATYLALAGRWHQRVAALCAALPPPARCDERQLELPDTALSVAAST